MKNFSYHGDEICLSHFSRRSHLAATRFHCFESGNSSSTSNPVQSTATTSGGSTSVQGDKNALHFGAETNTSNQDSNNVTSKTIVGNVKAGNGSTVNYTSNGLDASTLAELGKVLAGTGGGGGGNASSPGGVFVSSPTSPALASTLGSSTNMKWAIIAAVATVIGVLWAIFKNKK